MDEIEERLFAVAVGFVCGGLPFSGVYMTATFVEGEFMVPVSDQPIAATALVFFRVTNERDLTLAMVHRGTGNGSPGTFSYSSRDLDGIDVYVLCR